MQWFIGLSVTCALDDNDALSYTLELLMQGEQTDLICELARSLDLGIDKIQVEANKYTKDDLPADAPEWIKELTNKNQGAAQRVQVQTVHPKFDDNDLRVGQEYFYMQESESAGTQRIFALAGPIVGSLLSGGVLVIDELDARLHPMMTHALVRLFNSAETNRNNTQLIFTAQDTNLLDRTLLRRDQIWFTEKDRQGASHLYSLAEFKEPVRNDANYERNYIKGRYGAVPFLGDLASLWSGSDAKA